jgi:hypothetical protein
MEVTCIIDMQPYFKAANQKELINQCCKILDQTMEKNNPIFIIEYELFEPKIKTDTHYKILSTIMSYDKVFLMMKKKDSAADIIIKWLNKLDPNNNYTISLCGVNLDACILATAIDLSEYPNTKVNIISKACDSSNKITPKENILSLFKNYNGINIIT